LSGDGARGWGGEGARELSGESVRGWGGESVRGWGGEGARELSGESVRELSGDGAGAGAGTGLNGTPCSLARVGAQVYASVLRNCDEGVAEVCARAASAGSSSTPALGTGVVLRSV